MALTKIDIIEAVAEQNGFPKSKSKKVVEILLEIVKSTLASGEDVMISNFGKFRVTEKQARRGRNPATGEDMMMAPRRVVGFRWSGRLRDKINK